MTSSEQLITLSDAARVAEELRAELITLLDRWQSWRSDPSYPGTGRIGPAWQAGLDRAIAGTSEAVAALPPGTDPAVLADLTQPLLATFWAHRPGPMADVVTKVAMLRLRALALRGDAEPALTVETVAEPRRAVLTPA
ncbi:hypothetical protein Cs7R123_29670 [Catellatospora sp. TT07R-123]|uniref:hypothetical protein n=1 Tax=Catellatospora sp. TT07R-123 TaxID=2733863 RepID=UPI001B264605|nr:hypothetical protein [Catellatospora sp. TT07R-123]GHJ45625.1 hypothetical protein Cs7R123_29670 [Catellatospora sp. TT07R-123]